MLPQEFRPFAVKTRIIGQPTPKTVKRKFASLHPHNKTAKGLRDSGAPLVVRALDFQYNFCYDRDILFHNVPAQKMID